MSTVIINSSPNGSIMKKLNYTQWAVSKKKKKAEYDATVSYRPQSLGMSPR